MPKLWENPAIDVARCDKQTPYPTVQTMAIAIDSDSLDMSEIELTADDFILEPIDSAPAADLSDVWAIVDVPTPYVWSANYSPVHFAQVLSAAAYYAAAPDRERFATVRKIGRAVRLAIVGILYTLAHVADRAASRLELAR